ncbi:MAG: nucleotidyltransferase family protein [Planctomycetota bacterium]|jgi:CTP:molybdopterin cytidylyltransferase MocA
MTSTSNDLSGCVSPNDLALVVLAAGRSTRMGVLKPLVEVDGRPLLEHLLAVPWLRRLGEVVVVLGHHADRVRPVVDRSAYRHVVNPDPDRGRTSSVQSGLAALRPGLRAVFVQPVDCPMVWPTTYGALAEAMSAADVAVPTHRGRHGHPPLVSARIVPAIQAADADEPLRRLLKAPGVGRVCVEVDDPGVLLNVDRPEDLEQLRSVYTAWCRAVSKT